PRNLPFFPGYRRAACRARNDIAARPGAPPAAGPSLRSGAQIRHHSGDFDRRAGGLGATINLVFKTTFTRVQFLGKSMDAVDDRNAVIQGDPLERVSDGTGQIFRVISLPLYNHAEGEDYVRL